VKRSASRRAWFASVLVFTTSATVATTVQVDDLVCPPQTVYKRIDIKTEGVFSEGCRDAQGQRQGPYRFRRSSDGSVEASSTYVDNKKDGAERYYNAEGELLYTTIFSMGVSGKLEFTRAGWAEVARMASEQLKRDGKQVSVSVSGPAGLLIEHTTPIPRPAAQASGFSSRMRREFMPIGCGLLKRNPQLESVDLLIRWADGEIASVERFRSAQCRSSLPVAP